MEESTVDGVGKMEGSIKRSMDCGKSYVQYIQEYLWQTVE